MNVPVWLLWALIGLQFCIAILLSAVFYDYRAAGLFLVACIIEASAVSWRLKKVRNLKPGAVAFPVSPAQLVAVTAILVAGIMIILRLITHA